MGLEVGTALLIGSGISAIASMGAAHSASKASTKAAEIQARAARESAAAEEAAYDDAIGRSERAQAQTREDLAPYVGMARQASNRLMAGMGMPVQAPQMSSPMGGGGGQQGSPSGDPRANAMMRRRPMVPAGGNMMMRRPLAPRGMGQGGAMGGGGTVRMVYPQTGEIADVPEQHVEHYRSRGAQVVQ